jgi:hypothetical protein
MIGREQSRCAVLFTSWLLRMKRHEGHDQSGGCVAAEKTISLRQNNPNAGVGRAQGGAESGWPPTNDQDVRFGSELRDARR